MNVQMAVPVTQRLRTEFALYWKTDGGRLIHAAKTVIAVTVALWVSMRLELATPRNTMISLVILMMHQQAGMVIARGFYRALGMLAGGLFGLLLIGLFPQQPLPFFLTLAAWIGFCVWGAAYYRNYQSYGFSLAGYATAITAVPSWVNPYGIFDSVVYTLSEVAIGVVCASLVSALIWPQQVTTALLQMGQRHLGSFLAFVRHALLGKLAPDEINAAHVALVAERGQVDSLRAAAVFEDPELRLNNAIMVRLNHAFLDASAGVHTMRQIRTHAAHEGDEQALSAIDSFFHEFLSLLPDAPEQAPSSLSDVRALRGRLQAFIDAMPARVEHYRATLADAQADTQQTFATSAASLYFAVTDLNTYLTDYIAIRESVTERLRHPGDKLRPERMVSTANGMAATAAGIRAMVAVLIVASLWIASGWTGGSSAVVGAAITSGLFAVAPQPAVAARQAFLGCLAGWLAAFAFTFFVLPRLDGFVLLAACLAPFVMVGSYVNSFPRTAVLGLAFNIYFFFTGNITNPSVFDPTALLDTGFALLTGIGSAALAFSVIVPYGGAWATASYVRQIRRLVSRSACGSSIQADQLLRFESSMRDFIIQIAGRPVSDKAGRDQLLGWAFTSLEVGRAVIQVRQDAMNHEADLPPTWPPLLWEWQSAIANLFEQVTPQRHARALEATVQALQALPVPPAFTASGAVTARYRMRALLHATELTLLDDTLPLRSSQEAAP
jgi:uncharacterized membrane protein YccC